MKRSNYEVDLAKHGFCEANASPADINNVNAYGQILLANNRQFIEGKRVLDLASHDGRHTYASLALGAERVTSVEARAASLDRGRPIIDRDFPGKTDFVVGDLFDFLPTVAPGEFDTLLCFGFLYHTIRQVEIVEQARRMGVETFLLATFVTKRKVLTRRGLKEQPGLKLIYEDPECIRNTIEKTGLAAWPNCSFLEHVLEAYGFRHRKLRPGDSGISEWRGLEEFKKGRYVAYVASRT